MQWVSARRWGDAFIHAQIETRADSTHCRRVRRWRANGRRAQSPERERGAQRNPEHKRRVRRSRERKRGVQRSPTRKRRVRAHAQGTIRMRITHCSVGPPCPFSICFCSAGPPCPTRPPVARQRRAQCLDATSFDTSSNRRTTDIEFSRVPVGGEAMLNGQVHRADMGQASRRRGIGPGDCLLRCCRPDLAPKTE